MFAKALFAGLALALAAATQAPPIPQTPPWPDTFVARLEALALMQTLNAEILASRSATASLETWCRDHRLAAEPKIVAQVLAGDAPTPTPEQRQRLQVGDRDDVRYRHMLLRCGAHVLSDAENWYVPQRLTAEMNRLLDTTTPFGKAVATLEPYRRTFVVTLLWTPLAAGWEGASNPPAATTGRTLAIPDALFEHRALLYTREHRPFSEVHEVYQRELLAFPPRLQ
jgi:chorismate-pyruvate lyase